MTWIILHIVIAIGCCIFLRNDFKKNDPDYGWRDFCSVLFISIIPVLNIGMVILFFNSRKGKFIKHL